MKPAIDRLLLHSVNAANILPLTSVCNVRCVFCSNPQNPPDLETYNMPPLSLEKLAELLEFIDPTQKIVIGESVTRLNEGEPLTHPYFKSVIRLIRSRFPETPVQITTNGILLTDEVLAVLENAGNVELNISLNSVSHEKRWLLMRDSSEQRVVANLARLRQARVTFHGSVVAVPHLTGWDDLRDTIAALAETGALSTRVFLPGYTRWGKEKANFKESLWEEVHSFINKLRTEFKMPISYEPPILEDLCAQVEGIFPGSPAEKAGLRIGDRIISVNGSPVISRVDAFHRIKESGGKVTLILQRNNWSFSTCLVKKPGEAPGVLMSYDVDQALLQELVHRSRRKGYKKVLLLVSSLGKKVMEKGIQALQQETEFVIRETPNRYLGGTIKAAGLLVLEDFIQALKEEKGLAGQYDAVFLPAVAFDVWGRDLRGCHYMDLARNCPIKLELV
ncbi:radical SAM protein [Thermincola ferriacetica]|uniref:Radical SAM protein n=1 Tax=Thermincola ferriacetica TaxID=281456 RepID=A0A0L6W2U2_9FIRM|nr:DUF512 domain-containing protein [Thermincola ferriacetica]KNZ69892.1 radical SAM protein [Thermincola ferriacetica]